MREEVDRGMHRPNDVPSQLDEELLSRMLRGFQEDAIRRASINRLVPNTGTLQPVPESGEILRAPAI